MRVGLSVALAAMALSCSASRSPAALPMPTGEGSVWVYLDPLSGEADRLELGVAGITAVSSRGDEAPLTLSRRVLGGAGSGGQQLLAVGALPPGSYTALRITIESARLRDGREAADLRVPDGPTRIGVSFTIDRRKAVVLSIHLRDDEALVSGFRFAPAFDAVIPSDPALGLVGLAACRGSNTVSLYEKTSGHTFAVVPVGVGPASIALDQTRRRAFVSLAGDHAVAVLGLEERAVLEQIQLGAGDQPEELALTPDGRTLLTANAGSGTVSVIDVGARVETDRIRVGDGPQAVRIDRAGRRAYVFNTLSDSVSVIDLTRLAVSASLSVDPEPLRGELDRAGERLYVIHGSTPYLTVIDVADLTVSRQVYVGTGATALTVDPRTGRILLARAGATMLDVYDPTSLLPVDFLPLDSDVRYMTIDEEGNHLHAVLAPENRIRALRLSNKKVLAEVDVGADPSWVALMGEP